MDPAVLTAIVLVLVITALGWLHRAPDFTIWGGVALLCVVPVVHDGTYRIGVIVAKDALGGLANDGVVTIACMFIVAAGLRETGVMNWLADRFFGKPKSLVSAQVRLLIPTALLSGFLNNTPLVAMLMPITQDWAKRNNFSSSMLLMPLSFAAILGGACTLIGTSTNVIVNGWLIEEMGHPGLGMFEMTSVAAPIAIVGIACTIFFSHLLLPLRKPALQPTDDPREYVVEMIVDENSELIGQTVESAGLRGLPELYLIEIERDNELIAAVSSNIELHANDRLVFAGVVDSVVDLQRFNGLRPASDQVFKLDGSRSDRVLLEAVVSDSCPLVGATIKEGRFRTIYNAAVLAVARNGERINKKIGDIELRAGDTLLLEARANFHEQQRNRRDFYLVSKVDGGFHFATRRAPVAVAIMIAVVSSVTFGHLSMLQASLCGAIAMVASGCCKPTNARRAIDWEVLLVISGALALGRAMDVSGLAAQIGQSVQTIFGTNPTIMLAAIFALAMIFAGTITAKAAAVLMLPIALAVATALNVSYMPYVIAVMLASSTSVATPIGYPTNLMVYGPGGYRFSDYLRVGAPLSLIIWIMGVLLIPLAWPF
ncbi:MAG: SLC13 family permease [Proteobacteria bacterium]|nr:SLC13 family permease [Pseudomonadota bacterium]